MPRSTNTVRVQAIPGELMRFRVESWEDPKHPHTVDLLEHDGNGECDCWDFRKTCLENFRANGRKVVPHFGSNGRRRDRTQCRHITAADFKYRRELYADLAQRYRVASR